jgi:hypothetical protein
MKGDGLISRDPAMLGTSGYARLTGDDYFTPAWVTAALLSNMRFCGAIWGPAAGRGDMVAVLRAAGYLVIASDISGPELGCSDAAEIDFLAAQSMPVGALSIVTNPLYEFAEEFIRQALRLTEPAAGAVAMLGRHEYDCAAGRRDLFAGPPFARKIVLTKRPELSESNIASPRHNFAWFIWDWRHCGSATLTYAP